MELLIEQLEIWFKALDWMYIFSLIIISYFLTKDKVVNGLKGKLSRLRLFLLSIPKVWRVLIIGVLWGVAIFYLRDYNNLPDRGGKKMIEGLISSLFVAMVFYQMFLKKLLGKFSEN